jgi:hypothetical protein
MSSAVYGTPAKFYVPTVNVAGALTQLGCAGMMQGLLTSAPSLTFWRYRYLQYSNFAMQSVMQTFNGTVGFGQTVNAPIQKVGDLLYFLYVTMQIPGIQACPPRAGGCGSGTQFPYAIDPNNPCARQDAAYFAELDGGMSAWFQREYGCAGAYDEDCGAGGCGVGTGACDTEPFVYYANAIGQLLVKRATLLIGSQAIDQLCNDFLFIWEELEGKPGKRLTEMVGKRYCRDELIADSSCTRTLYVPLPFFFTQCPGNAMPLVSLAFSAPTIYIEFTALADCIIVSSPDVVPVKVGSGGAPIQNCDLVAALDGTQIFVDILERDRFASAYFEQLITQTQFFYQQICCGTSKIPLSVSTPVTELIWAFRRQCQSEHNNWFNYSGIFGRDPIVGAEIIINSVSRQAFREAGWYRMVQPYQFHTCIPETFIYCYSFALYPGETCQPSGCIAAARLENFSIFVQMQPGLEKEDVTMIVIIRTLNLIKYREGVAGAVFA